MNALIAVSSAMLGAVIASVVSCIPGLHIYNVLALMIAVVSSARQPVQSELFLPFVSGMIVAFGIYNTIPSILLSAPDESALFTVLPGQKYYMAGRAFEAVMLTSLGGLCAIGVLLTAVAPLAPRILPTVQTVLRPHMHWIIWCVILFMLLSEWPKEGRLGQAGWRRFVAGWGSLWAGWATFVLSGLLGFIIFYRSPLPSEFAFQNLMPAFVGLFTIPWLLLNLFARVPPIPQRITFPVWDFRRLLHGTIAGTLGGAFAAFTPGVTGGVGGMLAGHATAIRDDRTFLISQGASKAVYYVGGFLLFFVPGLRIVRGGGAWMVQSWITPQGFSDYYMLIGSLAVAAAVSFILLDPIVRGTIRLLTISPFRRISASSLILILVLVMVQFGGKGIAMTFVAAAIGLIPPLFGTRRMNCLGIVLLPLACNLSEIGPSIARILGLL